ncbi:ultraviolet-B receptor UVR8-like isoform X1 [Primulina eburnea]|uniref:ultraviolet-B receptor UVR8-like isoform X1 n=1 Tax=Primulina eburnea TaxID=1245227 RepID=UPI003C6C05BE
MAFKTVVIAWGSGEDGQLGIGNSEEKEWVCAISALSSSNVCSVVAGSRNSLAICDDVNLFTWGWNQRGTLGHPQETKNENVPSQVKALANVKIIQVIKGFEADCPRRRSHIVIEMEQFYLVMLNVLLVCVEHLKF